MDLELNGKVALVTGAGQGIGRGIATVLAAEGAKVAVNDFYRERAEKVAKELEASGGVACGVQADVRDLEQVREMVSTVDRTLGPVDILVTFMIAEYQGISACNSFRVIKIHTACPVGKKS
jgi:3-oxoacyl-[acyl-carrier protein] reductase